MLGAPRLGGGTSPGAARLAGFPFLTPSLSHTCRNFSSLGESFGSGLNFGVSSAEGFPPRIWLCLREFSQSDHAASGFSLVLVAHRPSLQPHSQAGVGITV